MGGEEVDFRAGGGVDVEEDDLFVARLIEAEKEAFVGFFEDEGVGGIAEGVAPDLVGAEGDGV